ncbi:unnamed protein product [Zymoseptoria tritici ST99CH_3D7]|uniref:L-dopachrome isomerase n=1 Tax=Zymoseptoria tritici (strain ST99CH_3D7) TaxID=1276538 RepID=A0A1X7RLF5_ZYMT9|nr:unnamed protein product [Zymoseptoria tritici ST99CH_3D7]
MSAATSPTMDTHDDSSGDSATTMTSTATSISILRPPYPSSQMTTPGSHRAHRDSHRNSGYFSSGSGSDRNNIDPGDFLQKHLGRSEEMLYDDRSKRRSQYYEDEFRYKDGAVGSVRERVQTESPVIAELRTNVIVKDEFTLVTDLSFHLAARYARPNSSIMVQVQHSACLSFGGTFDPCYILTLQAVPSSMGPTTNKRNAALIQAFMADTMKVPAERGIIKFQPIAEENLAQGGTTIMGDIERQEKQHAIEHGHSVKKAITAASRKSLPSMRKSAAQRSSMDGKEVASLPPINTKDISRDSFSSSRPKSIIITTTAIALKRHSIGEVIPPLSATILSPSDIYELPCDEPARPLPSAPVIPTLHRSSSVSNGLRMNPVSPLDCAPRPLTIGSSPFSTSGSTIAEKRRSASEPLLINTNTSTGGAAPAPPPIRKHTSSRPHSFLKTDPSAPPSPGFGKNGQPVSVISTRPKTSDGSSPRGPTAFHSAPPGVTAARGNKSSDRASLRAAERERLSDKFIRPKTAHELRPLGGGKRSSLKNGGGKGSGETTLKAFGTSAISAPIGNTTFLQPPTLVSVSGGGGGGGGGVKSHTSVRVPSAALGALRPGKPSLRSASSGSFPQNHGTTNNFSYGSGDGANTAKRRSTMTSSTTTATPAIPEDEVVQGGWGSGYGNEAGGKNGKGGDGGGKGGGDGGDAKSLKGSLGGKRRSLMKALMMGGGRKVRSEGF